MATDMACTEITKAPSNHSHPPDAARVAAVKTVVAIKDRASTIEETKSSVINHCIQNFPLSAAAALPRRDHLARMVRRKRLPTDGDDLLNRLTTRGEEFVSMEEDGLVIFKTDENLNVLRENRHWCCDGTFDSAPEGQQLFTIQVLINSTHTVPLVYCITDRKDEETYIRILEHLRTKRPDLAPLSITMDFELAASNAMSTVFSNIEIAGCFFYFLPSIV